MSVFAAIWEDLKFKHRSGDIITRLILINVIVWLAVNLFRLPLVFAGKSGTEINAIQSDYLFEFISLPLILDKFPIRFWTILSYNFVHQGFWHLLWNMLFLWWFGRIMMDFLGARRILPTYIYGGIAGGALALLICTFFPQMISGYQPQLIGASAGVSAVLMAAASIAPRYELMLFGVFRVQLMYLVLFRIVLDLFAISYFNNAGGSIAHLGGVFYGYLFVSQLQQGNDLSIGFNRLMDRIVNYTNNFGRRGPRVAYRNEKLSRKKNVGNSGSNPGAANSEDKLNRILDKISESGYSSLSKEEQQFLFKKSKEE
jgi:membrane associated rhomboid family serine protease